MKSIRIVDLVSDDESRKYEPAGRMAAAIVELTEKHGGCLPQDLNEIGFSPAEVAEHWHLAKSIAGVELKLMRDRSDEALGGGEEA